jgi:nucleoside 2-deoxyribosyltransferase
VKARIYLSGPLFSQAEIAWGRCVKASIEEVLHEVEIVWPHELAADSAEEIFQANLMALDDCDLLVAILDGPQVDDGTAWEVGYFYAKGRKILGIRTDFRRAGESEHSRVNLMVESSCLALAESIEQLVALLGSVLSERSAR